jgi:AbrB family looped-hinge helix DNA binding protein
MVQLVSINKKRQITIPAPIFDGLGLKKGQKVLVTTEQGVIRIEPALKLVADLAGAVELPEELKNVSEEKLIKMGKKQGLE